MRWLYTMVGVLWCLAWLVTPGQAFVSKIRATDATKISCHQVFDLYRLYVRGVLTGAQALTRLEVMCNCTMVGADLTDLTNFKGVIDGIAIIEVGSGGFNTLETRFQTVEKLNKVQDAESACRLFELGNDAIATEAQVRSALGIP